MNKLFRVGKHAYVLRNTNGEQFRRSDNISIVHETDRMEKSGNCFAGYLVGVIGNFMLFVSFVVELGVWVVAVHG